MRTRSSATSASGSGRPPNRPSIAPAVNSVPCGNGPGVRRSQGDRRAGPRAPGQPHASQAQIREAAALIAQMDYSDYARQFLYPSNSLMIKSGLWLELEAVIGFVVGLGLGSLIGQRTVAVILHDRPRGRPDADPLAGRESPTCRTCSEGWSAWPRPTWRRAGCPVLGGGGGGPGGGGGNSGLLPESTTVAVCVIVAWLVGWSVLGAWRMMTRDA